MRSGSGRRRYHKNWSCRWCRSCLATWSERYPFPYSPHSPHNVCFAPAFFHPHLSATRWNSGQSLCTRPSVHPWFLSFVKSLSRSSPASPSVGTCLLSSVVAWSLLYLCYSYSHSITHTLPLPNTSFCTCYHDLHEVYQLRGDEVFKLRATGELV